MEKIYVYDWLDKLCAYDLNPALVYPGAISRQETEVMSALITQEIERVENQLKELFFAERKSSKLALLVNKYHDMLIVMMNRVHQNRSHPHIEATGLNDLLVFMLNKLEGLLLFFEQHFASYLNRELRVPQVRLIKIKRQIMEKWEALQQEMFNTSHNSLLNVVHGALILFIERIDKQQDMTIREAQYHRKLVDDLPTHHASEALMREMLIFRNLNNKASIAYFTKQVDMVLEHLATKEEKLGWLRLEYKDMQQKRVSRKMIYDPHYPGLKEYLCEYMENEMQYLEQKMEGIKPLNEKQTELHNFKVVCSLSADQIAVVLRAADEAKVVVARSLNAVFKAIVPYLSTQKKKDISWQSVRTKSYDTETRDKEIAIAALEEMIKKIRDY
ncbi:hypothetical protein [Pedobacter sp. ASV28]|uniref:hypothetical protein n=1 Tax=Pedobacter sp. ASV28 TaxID=2795123 RepID=UPI0018EC8820|nr:hypothetical protein [Pedobacter sp. ASV28]